MCTTSVVFDFFVGELYEMVIITKDKVIVTARKMCYIIKTDEIIYISKIKGSRKVKILLSSGENYMVNGLIKDFELLLLKTFYKLNKSFIININFLLETCYEMDSFIRMYSNIYLYVSLRDIRKLNGFLSNNYRRLQ